MVSVVDIGSNSVRFLHKGHKTLTTTRLGNSNQGNLTPEAMKLTANAISSYMEISIKDGCKPYIFATNAVRDAQNRADFLAMVKEQCGATVDVLSGEQEALLAFEGAAPRIPGMHCVLDQGGGSVEVTTGDNLPTAAVSLKLGAVRLSAMFPYGDPPDSDTLKTLYQYAYNEYSSIRKLFPAHIDTFTLTGGTVTTLASLDMALEQYNAALVHGYLLTADRLSSWNKRLCGLGLSQRRKLPGMDEKRADIIIAGAISVSAFIDVFGAKQARVSECDIIDAYAARVENK